MNLQRISDLKAKFEETTISHNLIMHQIEIEESKIRDHEGNAEGLHERHLHVDDLLQEKERLNNELQILRLQQQNMECALGRVMNNFNTVVFSLF